MADQVRDPARPGADREGELLEEIEAAMAPPRSHARFPLFDSLRGLAAISILFVHVAIFTDGFGDTWHGRLVAHLDIGVPFFFLLSAFLLYRPFVAARVRAGDRPVLAGYARRRFLRIAPAYWAVLTIAAIAPGMAGIFSGNWWVYYGLLQNYPVYTPEGICATHPYRCAIPPVWSLSIEVFFYVLLPFFVLLMAWLGKHRRGSWLGPELIAVVVLSIVSLLDPEPHPAGRSRCRPLLLTDRAGLVVRARPRPRGVLGMGRRAAACTTPDRRNRAPPLGAPARRRPPLHLARVVAPRAISVRGLPARRHRRLS